MKNPAQTKRFNRNVRLLRLVALTRVYQHYAKIQTNRRLLSVENTWKQAEGWCTLMRIVLPQISVSPSDFMFDKNTLSDDILDQYQELKKWQKLCVEFGMSEQAIDAFCKNVNNTDSVPHLKTVGGSDIFITWLMSVYHDSNKIDFDESNEAYNNMKNILNMILKELPDTTYIFKQTVLEIETLITNITLKQFLRRQTKT